MLTDIMSCTLCFSLPAAVVLDLLMGDPHGWPHPVRWMGKAIEWFEPLCRKRFNSERLAGAAFSIFLLAATWVLTFSVLKALVAVHPVAGWIAETVVIYYCLSIRSLRDAAMEIYHLLTAGRVDVARQRVSYIVGRDVERYQAPDIARATVETVAENFVDGVLSPLFFVTIGGAPLMMAYKMVNTMDSMVGYKNERYRRFGTVAARIDDVANFIPARLSVLMIAAAAQLLSGRHGLRALKTGVKEGHRHSSPNAGYPEAAFAGALAVKLNGPNYYHGQLVDKPYIGEEFGPVAIPHIKRTCELMLLTSLLSAVVVWIVVLIF